MGFRWISGLEGGKIESFGALQVLPASFEGIEAYEVSDEELHAA